MKISTDRLIGIFGLIISCAGYIFIGQYNLIISTVIFSIGIIAILYSLNEILEKYRDGYEHKLISYEYTIKDPLGEETEIQVSHLLKSKKVISMGGGGFDSYPYNFESWITFVKKDSLPSDNKTKIDFSAPYKTGGFYYWDYYHKPPIKKGQVFCVYEKFAVRDRFTGEKANDCYYAVRKIKKFTWKINFPIERPCKKWWVTSDYIKNQPDNQVLLESNEKTNTIYFEINDLKFGFYYIHWEW